MTAIPEKALDGRLAIVGISGSGKSTTAKGGVEQLLSDGRRVCVVDLLDGWWGLRVKRNGTTPAYPVAIFGGNHGDLPLTENAGAIIGQAVAQSEGSTIVSLNDLTDDAARRRFALAFFNSLHKHNRSPLHLVVDEADFYAPQQPVKDGPGPMLLNRVKEIAARGRMRGFRGWFITQRPAKLHKDVLSQADTLIAMQLTSTQDRKALDAWIGDQGDEKAGKEMVASLPSLQLGEGVLWSPRIGILERRRFPLPATYDSSRTPEYGETSADVELKPLDLSAMKAQLAAVEKTSKENDPKALRARIAELERQAKQAPAALDMAAIEGARERGFKDAVAQYKAELVPLHAGLENAWRELQRSFGGFGGALEAMQRQIEIALEYRAAPHAARAPIPKTNGAAQPADASLPKGERACLIAMAQHSRDGVSREQLSVLVGYKRSSRDAYIQRLRERGMCEQRGDRLFITSGGVLALGEFEPLPTGDALRGYWLERLPQGESRILSLLCEQYPNDMARDDISEATGYKRSSRDVYLQRLSARELIETSPGRAGARAILFG